MNEQSEHLSNAQIEGYGDRTSGTAPDDRQTEEAWIEAHLDSCPSCRTRVLDFQRVRFGLLLDPKFVISEGAASKVADSKGTDRKLADDGFADLTQAAPKLAHATFSDPKQQTDRPLNTAPTPDCPSAEDLRQLAAGLLPDAVADQLTRHAATCDHCGPLLRTYTEDFAEEFSPEEQAVLAKLQSSSAEWQKKTAQEMIRVAGAVSAPEVSETQQASPADENDRTAASLPQKSSATHGRKPFWKWALVPGYAAATAAICLIVSLGTFGVWYTQRDTPEKVENMLAQAYTEQRPLEMRWPGASYSTVKSSRGASYPANLPLLEAQQIVDRHQGQQQWLLEDASVALLQRHPDAAIQMLSRVTTDFSCDRCTLVLAIAEIAEGDSTGAGKNYEAALRLLNSISSNSYEYNVAVYNRALVYERLGKVDEAVADWRTVLKTERDNGWVSEASQRLADLVAKQSK